MGPVEILKNRINILEKGIEIYTSHYRANGDHSHDLDIRDYEIEAHEVRLCLEVHMDAR